MIVKFLITSLENYQLFWTETFEFVGLLIYELSFLVLFDKSSNHLKLPYAALIICTVVPYTIRLNIKPLSMLNLQYLHYTTKQKIEQSKGITAIHI